jgi:hypothetical protein
MLPSLLSRCCFCCRNYHVFCCCPRYRLYFVDVFACLIDIAGIVVLFVNVVNVVIFLMFFVTVVDVVGIFVIFVILVYSIVPKNVFN